MRKNQRPIQLREAHVLVLNLLSQPEDWIDCLLRFATAIIIIGYGHQIVANDDRYLKLAEDWILSHFSDMFPPGFPVPIMPGLPAVINAPFGDYGEDPYALVTEQMAAANKVPIGRIQAAAAILYIAGVETAKCLPRDGSRSQVAPLASDAGW
ncbi:hypothetical protein LshimejAT787_0504530 [Lyophyllum shimeji]|uniref:Uncharacterized protein n=1 Tax=Lyophyllum shimeji TaxID=47721 RepID=A0A9P3UME9_LYOSH|nr:hypothetical protein LshimejAT787_0504530 [Lyophyllum shimeji]